MSKIPDNYWDKIPKWNSDLPQQSFVITADEFSGRIPVTRLDDWHDFTHLLESDFFNQHNVQLVFRGHRRFDWSMTPTLGRVTLNGIVTKELAERQLTLFRKAIRGRIKDHSLLDDGPEDDELWSIGQHHGLMTPLLDWTYSPYVALFFAFCKEDQIEEDDNPYRSIYILNKTFITDNEICQDIRLFEPKKDDHGRLVSQAGLFTYSPHDATIENKLAEILSNEEVHGEDFSNATEDEEPYILAKYICKIYVKNENQGECLKYLRRMNVHHASLFPDLIGAADYCNVFISETEKSKAIKTITSDSKEFHSEAPHLSFENATPKTNASNSIIDLLLTPAEASDIDIEKLHFMANEIANTLAKGKLIDWQERDSLKESMLAKTRIILRKAGYPESAREYVIKNILSIEDSDDKEA
ncbi:FRG domain-containing protein [Enterobacter hormaechei]|uniref:FRG domain-containing protein n=1 Tax=Enterobacter hormaechei TaxID=158836 RepID=UPI00118754C3|nr:FRG domain-containing protein [Enterobacter hormaechei]QDQ75363.1 FRG domain-containing protein [Enterobacter hormaechei subsp. steigerwaltii]HAV1656898.1 FRG domain-containing protein [Enterobacter hormaechei subsp. steigerwaltii]